MAIELQSIEVAPQKRWRKRKPNPGNANNASKKTMYSRLEPKAKKPSKKMMKLFRKRARDYNSDDEEEMTREVEELDRNFPSEDSGHDDDARSLDDEELDNAYEVQQGITKFAEGSRAFSTAFLNIMKKNLPNDLLGPILSANKKLVAEKLAEEDAEHKSRSEAKKEKYLLAQRGHVKPVGFLDSKEKFLISVATKGVVKLFNAVNKTQNPQKDSKPSKSKDAKAFMSQRKKTFLSELKKPTSTAAKVWQGNGADEEDEPGWAPLRESYMLTSSKMKDWDKMEDMPSGCQDENITFEESSSDED